MEMAATMTKLEQALALLAQTHRSMGHDPLLMMAIARQTLNRNHLPDTLWSVEYELMQMSDDIFTETVLGQNTAPGLVSNLTQNVLTDMRRCITGQDADPGIVLPKDVPQDAPEGP